MGYREKQFNDSPEQPERKAASEFSIHLFVHDGLINNFYAGNMLKPEYAASPDKNKNTPEIIGWKDIKGLENGETPNIRAARLIDRLQKDSDSLKDPSMKIEHVTNMPAWNEREILRHIAKRGEVNIEALLAALKEMQYGINPHLFNNAKDKIRHYLEQGNIGVSDEDRLPPVSDYPIGKLHQKQ